MLKSLCFVPSNNGYGHLRRVVAIARELKEKYEVQVTLVWNEKNPYPYYLHSPDVFDFIIFAETPQANEGPHIRSKNNKKVASKRLAKMLSQYEFVIADTLTWPLEISEDSAFLGQFTWEFYRERTQSFDEPAVSSGDIPTFFRKPAFGMGLFAWEEMSQFINFEPLDVMDYWNLRSKKLPVSNEILVSLSGTGQISMDLMKVLSFIPAKLNGLENYISAKGEIPLAVICRPGMGIISECISAKVIPIIIEENDAEMQFNSRILFEKLGVGIGFKEIMGKTKEEVVDFLKIRRRDVVWPAVTNPSYFLEEYLYSKDLDKKL